MKTHTEAMAGQGWFVHMKSVGGGLRCFERISDLSSVGVKAFVTGSKIIGLHVETFQNGKSQYKQRQFLSGTVFRADRIYASKVRVSVGTKFRLFKKTKLQDVKYLKCYDVQNREILLAFDKIGKFFEISPIFVENNGQEKYVFNTETLFSWKQMISPVMIIYGQSPRVENFSGILYLQRKFLDHTVVAATSVDRHNHVVLEIATSSSSRFHLALNSKDIIRHGDMSAVLKHCKRKADEFVQRIRVPFALSRTEAENINCSDNGNGSFEVPDESVRKLDSIVESDEEEEESQAVEKDDVSNCNESGDEKKLLLETARPTENDNSFEKSVELDDEKDDAALHVTDDNAVNEINNSLHQNTNEDKLDQMLKGDEIVTVTVEEKLIDLTCMEEVMLCSTTTATTTTSEADVQSIPLPAGKEKEISQTSENDDFEQEKMSDSDPSDDADSGISGKN